MLRPSLPASANLAGVFCHPPLRGRVRERQADAFTSESALILPARRAATMAGVSLYRTQAFNSIFADDSIDKDLSTYATLTRDSITCNCVIWNGGAVKGTGRISAIICMRFTCSLLDCGRLVVSSPQSRFWNSRRTLGATLYVLPKLACRDARRSRQAHLLQQRTYAG
jgi:hypothetical protein